MISLATGVIIGLSGIAGGGATLLTNDAIVKYNRDTNTIEKRAAKMGEKLTKNVNKRRKKLEFERERFKSENPGIADNDASMKDFMAEDGLYYEEESNKLIRKQKVKNAIAETVIPTVVGGLVTAGMVAVCSAIADGCADDSDVDDDEE